MVGNKTDLKALRCVQKEEALKKIKDLNLSEYIETSALLNTHIEELFYKIGESNNKIF